MTKARGPRAALALIAAGAAVTTVVMLAGRRAGEPARCAEGTVALGARCCGEGQALEGGRCVGAPKRCAPGQDVTHAGCIATPRRVLVAGGHLEVGPGDWEAQGVVAPMSVDVPTFAIDAHEVSQARFSECVAAGACAALPTTEPGLPRADLDRDEAKRFCAWSAGSLPTAAQLAWAAAGPTRRRYAWGDTGAVCRRVTWGLRDGPCGFGGTGPDVIGSRPDGASADGALDLAASVAEWTASGSDAAAEVRGGSWADGAAAAIRSWARREVPAETRSTEIGFRCVYAVR